ncbi:hypothetical protein [Winogradskyella sp. UBA3174]|uniref:hypothetical protein n=1 Tax=Winogradskyella sp. UBA3174 TaxID=1947785 RepID=UPI0025E8CFF1|nr:hypothetical protein [Winogradskyella sp. UBA3174]|tara:strand:- start:39348 stop:39794 length:447 start_codon:yes stop_codon:yes gene_type:complete
MKNKNNGIDKVQIESYLSISKSLKINKLVTISNEFVADSSHSAINVKVPRNIFSYHFSWTYLITKGRLLLFKNDLQIQDNDQVEIMSEALSYFESSIHTYIVTSSEIRFLEFCIEKFKEQQRFSIYFSLTRNTRTDAYTSNLIKILLS